MLGIGFTLRRKVVDSHNFSLAGGAQEMIGLAVIAVATTLFPFIVIAPGIVALALTINSPGGLLTTFDLRLSIGSCSSRAARSWCFTECPSEHSFLQQHQPVLWAGRDGIRRGYGLARVALRLQTVLQHSRWAPETHQHKVHECQRITGVKIG